MAHQRALVRVESGSARATWLLPRVIVWVRTGSRDWRDRWHKLVRALGLEIKAEAADLGDGWITVYDVTGAPAALQELTSGAHKCVQRWEYATTAGTYRSMTHLDRAPAVKVKDGPADPGKFHGIA